MNIKRFLIKARDKILVNINTLNEYNRYPVSDADTGSNILHTINYVLEHVNFDQDINLLKKDLISNLGKSGRGNSGIILSAMLSGFFEEYLGAKANAYSLHKALISSRKRSYNSVVHPQEGTMLSIIRRASETPVKTDIQRYASDILAECYDELLITQNFISAYSGYSNMDSGALGVYLLMEIFFEDLGSIPLQHPVMPQIKTSNAGTDMGDFIINKTESKIYCLELDLQLSNKGNIEKLMALLSMVGESIVKMETEEGYKIHIHVDDPVEILNCVVEYAFIVKVKIENMVIQQLSRTDRSVLIVCNEKRLQHFFASKGVFFTTIDSPLLKFARKLVIIANDLPKEIEQKLRQNHCEIIFTDNDYESYILYVEGYRKKSIVEAADKLKKLAMRLNSFTITNYDDIVPRMPVKRCFLAIFTDRVDEGNRFIESLQEDWLEVRLYKVDNENNLHCVLVL